jgi:acetyl esterase/lipase
MVSPWISFETNSPSFFDNVESDYLTTIALDRASGAFVGPGNPHDEYSEPIRAPPTWWKEVAEKVGDEVMIWGGGGEVLIDGIRTFATTIAEGFADADAIHVAAGAFDKETVRNERGAARHIGKDRVRYVETPKEAHEVMIICYNLPLKEKSGAGESIERWFKERLDAQTSPAGSLEEKETEK